MTRPGFVRWAQGFETRMNPLDTYIVGVLNSFARRSWTFDWLVFALDSNNLFKGGVMAALMLTVWFGDSGDSDVMKRRRASIVSGLLATCVAVVVARVVSFAFPF